MCESCLNYRVGQNDYPIFFNKECYAHLKKCPYIVVADENVKGLAKKYIKEFNALGFNLKKEIYLEVCEFIKSIEGYSHLSEKVLPYLDRYTYIIAIGGGVLADLVGFTASTLLRGVKWINIPTTFLAQVDSCVGGKTALNTPFGKNLIGSFYFPEAVIIDTQFLQTLSKRAYLSGLSECIKHGLIASKKFLEYFPNCSDERVYESLRLKINIINHDWFECYEGTRSWLNLGHTVGHALELMSDYSLYHGEAVSRGIAFDYHLAVQLGICNKSDYHYVLDLFSHYELDVEYKSYLHDTIKFISYLKRDKKNNNNKIAFTLPNGIGEGCVIKNFTAEEFKKILKM